MKLCTAVQEGCGYKDTLRARRYFAPLAKYFTVCITYQPPLVIINLVKKDAEKILKYEDLVTEIQPHVECESKSDTGDNNGNWYHFKVTQTVPEQHTGKARN